MIKSFGNLDPGTCFKPLKAETIRDKEVFDESIHVKIADSHAVRVSDHKDSIFLFNMPCRIVKNHNFDFSKLPDWAMINKGKPKK